MIAQRPGDLDGALGRNIDPRHGVWVAPAEEGAPSTRLGGGGGGGDASKELAATITAVLFGLILCGACCLPIVQTLRGGGRSHGAHARVRVEEDDASDDDDDGGMYPARNGRYSM